MGLVAGYGSSDESDSEIENDKGEVEGVSVQSVQPPVQPPVQPTQVESIPPPPPPPPPPYIIFPDFDSNLSPFEIERLKLRALTQPDQMPQPLSMNDDEIDEPNDNIEQKIAKLLELKRTGKASLNEKLANNIDYNRPGFVDGQLKSLLQSDEPLHHHQSLPKEGYIENLIEASKEYKKNRTRIEFVSKT